MTKYFCSCGREINYLVALWQDSIIGRYVAHEVYFFCKIHADSYMQLETYEGLRTITPVCITASTKSMATKQIVAQYLKSGESFYLPKTDIKSALVDVKKM